MTTWPSRKLADLAVIVMGQSPPGDTYNADGRGLPFFQGKAEFSDEYPKVQKWCDAPLRIAEPGDVLLSVRAPVGPTNVAREKCCIGRGLAAIRPKTTKLNPRFLRYFFAAFESQIAQQGAGSTFDAIGRSVIENLEFRLPPLAEQERIVRILNEAKALCHLRGQADDQISRTPAALFNAMFPDVHAAVGGWPITTLETICSDIVSGGTPSTDNPDFWNGSIPWISPKDMKSSELFDAIDHVSKSALKATRLKLLPPDAVLIVVRGMILAHSFPVAITRVPATINQDMKALLSNDQVLPDYLYSVLVSKTPNLLSSVSTAGHGTKRLEMKEVFNLPVAIPPKKKQEEFVRRITELRELKAAQSVSRQRLDDLFKSLLQRAFRGEL
jgi:type I restriction enzyme, S subunit